VSKITLHFNGLWEAAFYPGSPRKAGRIACYGWTIQRGKKVLASGHGTVPQDAGTTLNVASYMALIAGLQALVKMNHAGPVKIQGDSKLVIQEMSGKSHPSCDRMRSFHREANQLVEQLGQVTWCHVPRKRNREAEAQSWQAYTKAWERGPFLLKPAHRFEN
jgi:ribonuclease HI